MVVPETVTRTADVSSIDFPAPAITICSNLFAREEFVNFFKVFHDYREIKNYTISEQKCRYLIANLHWCQPDLDKFVKDICGQYDLQDLNVVETINKSALSTEELFHSFDKPLGMHIVRVFTAFGICYTYNMQGFNAIFNTEVIHDDFKCYLRKDFESSGEDQWTLEKGYSNYSNFPGHAMRGPLIYFDPILTPANKENICSINNSIIK